VATKREELEQYRERVSQELRLRGDKLKDLDGRLASTDYLLRSVSARSTLKSGDTVRVLTQASYRAKLRRDREALERRRGEALEDVKRAETRLEDVIRELQELEEIEGGSDDAGTDERGDD